MIAHTILDNIRLLDGRNITLVTGFAIQTNGSIIVSMGNTMLLATVFTDKEVKEDVDILALIVDDYAAGKRPGGFIKRERRALDSEILTMRFVDRILRPLFPKKFYSDIQLIISLLSYDNEILPNGLAALAISDIPFYGPISSGRLVRLNVGKFIINPNFNEVLNSDIDIIIGGSKESIIMMEGEIKEVSEEEVLEAIIFAHKAIKNQIEAQVRLAKRVKKSSIKRFYKNFIEYKNIILKYRLDKENLEFLKKKEQKKFMHHYYFQLKREAIRDLIIRVNYRIDGRTSKEIRSLYCVVDCVPSTHETALFMRVKTQSLTSVTLGPSTDINRIDKEINEKFYLHLHYNFTPFSTEEIRLLRIISRREVGHGNLAQSALKNVIIENTPYTIRVVSEYNGSSSMATVCAASLALMDLLKDPVAGGLDY